MTQAAETPTHMAAELAETPAVVARFLEAQAGALAALGTRLRALDAPVVITCARGSSDNAAAYFKYLTEIVLGVPVASIGPSIASIYEAPLRLKGTAVISVSQSGKSPDIVALQAAARKAGAYAVAVVNVEDSPLAHEADAVLPLGAGLEKSVAATKTCVASAAAMAAIVAAWSADADLRDGLSKLPEALETAAGADWSAALPVLAGAASTYVIGRGPALPMAVETALKLKETAVLHAEAYSGAEVLHGPLQIVGPGFPVLGLRPRDAAHAGMGETLARMAREGGKVFVAGNAPEGTTALPFASGGHALLDPMAMLLSAYRLAETVARGRGHDPDRPSKLRKVTETV